MAKPMKTAGTPTSRTHRTRLRRYSRIPALSTATTRAVTDAVPAAEGVIDLATASGATTGATARSEEHTSELQSLMRTSYAVFCLKNKYDHHTHKQINSPETN